MRYQGETPRVGLSYDDLERLSLEEQEARMQFLLDSSRRQDVLMPGSVRGTATAVGC